jgi:hypothetical protein
LPTPRALVTVTSHAPTSVGLDAAAAVCELAREFASRLAQDGRTAKLKTIANARSSIGHFPRSHAIIFA